MQQFLRQSAGYAAAFAFCLGTTGVACAQSSAGQKPLLTRGFESVARVNIINEEIVRQPDLWQMECQLKSMRMVWVPSRDPVTGAATQEQIWYLPYRCCRRPIAARAAADVVPRNEFDPAPGPKQFLPSATLVTYDDPKSEVPVQIIQDTIIPEAMPAILRVERAAHKNSVEIAQDVPRAFAETDENQEWILGVFTFRGMNPDTDFFKVIVNGCGNGYEKRTGPTGEPEVWRKVIVQRFKRPGDRYDPSQREFQFVGPPTWVLQPDKKPAVSAPVSVSTMFPPSI